MDTTERGFAIYGRLKDTRGLEIRVQESSADPLDFVWIFVDGDGGFGRPGLMTRVARAIRGEEVRPSPNLNVEQVKELIKALQAFVDDKAQKDRDDDRDEHEQEDEASGTADG